MNRLEERLWRSWKGATPAILVLGGMLLIGLLAGLFGAAQRGEFGERAHAFVWPSLGLLVVVGLATWTYLESMAEEKRQEIFRLKQEIYGLQDENARLKEQLSERGPVTSN